MGADLVLGLLYPIRIATAGECAVDFFLPTTVNHASEVEDVALRVFAILGAIILDLLTLAIRFVTVIPRLIIGCCNQAEDEEEDRPAGNPFTDKIRALTLDFCVAPGDEMRCYLVVGGENADPAFVEQFVQPLKDDGLEFVRITPDYRNTLQLPDSYQGQGYFIQKHQAGDHDDSPEIDGVRPHPGYNILEAYDKITAVYRAAVGKMDANMTIAPKALGRVTNTIETIDRMQKGMGYENDYLYANSKSPFYNDHMPQLEGIREVSRRLVPIVLSQHRPLL